MNYIFSGMAIAYFKYDIKVLHGHLGSINQGRTILQSRELEELMT